MSQGVFDPNDIYNQTEQIGTTQTPVSLLTTRVQTEDIRFKDGSWLTGISQKFTDNQYNTAPSSFALFMGLSTLDSQLRAIDPDSNYFKDNTVISLPLINTFFKDPWIIQGWDILDEKAFFTGTLTPVENYLQIPASVIHTPGYHYLNLTIDRLDSGFLRIYDHTGTLVKEFDKAGEHNIEMYIVNSDITSFRFIAEEVFPGDYIKISDISVFQVRERFRDYFMHQLKSLGLQGADEELLTRLITQAVNTLTAQLSVMINENADKINTHLTAPGNVHGVTPEMIGAAPTNHTHNEFTTLHDEIVTVNDLLNDLRDSIQNNAGGITADMIGAAPVNHTHTPDQCGAAPVDHSHPEYMTIGSGYNIDLKIHEAVSTALDGRILLGRNAYLARKTTLHPPLPKEAQKLKITPVLPVFSFNYLPHFSKTNFDLKAGYFYSNRESVDTDTFAIESISGYHRRKIVYQEDLNNLVLKTDDIYTCKDLVKPVFRYTFMAERKLGRITVSRHPDSWRNGHPVKIKVYADDRAEPIVFDWEKDTNFTNLEETITTQQLTLEVEELFLPSHRQWSMGIVLRFSDVETGIETEDNKVVLNTPLTLSTGSDPKLDINGTNPITNNVYLVDGQSTFAYLKKFKDTGDWILQTNHLPPVFSNRLDLVSPFFGKPVPNSGILQISYSAGANNPEEDVTEILISTDQSLTKTGGTEHTLTINSTDSLPVFGGLRFIFNAEMFDQNEIMTDLTMQITYRSGIGAHATTNVKTIEFKGIQNKLTKISDTGYEIYLPIMEHDAYIQNVIQVKLDCTTKNPTFSIKDLHVLACAWLYNPETGESSDNGVIPMGVFTGVKQKGSNDVHITHPGLPTNATTLYPIKEITEVQPGTYIVPNVYFDPTISAKLCLLTEPDTPLTEVPGVITNIDYKDVTVRIDTAGTYAVRMEKTW